jgi:P27 family predicted phage terminase small subunit
MPTPRKSPEEHELTGAKPHYEVAPANVPLVASRPRYPKGLTPEARRVFKQLVQQLENRRALTEGDRFLLHVFAETWDRRARAQEKLLAQGEVCLYTRLDPNGVAHQLEKPNLNLKVLEAADKTIVAILDRLGLTPLAGSKVKQTRPSENLEEITPGTMAWFDLQAKKNKETK